MTQLPAGRHINADVVDIRWLDVAAITATDWPRLEMLLDPQERARAARFHFEHDRHCYAAAHALLRSMLSEQVPVPPSDWSFTTNPQGKPETVMPPGYPRLRVNLSHTRGLAAAVLTVDHDVGIDVEWCERGNLTLDIADRFFAPAEVAALNALPVERLNDGLFAFWTLKEAFIKAVGLGLSLPLDDFAFTLEPLAIGFPPGREIPGPWLFQRFRPTDTHAMALALRHPDPARVSVTARPTDPATVLSHSGSKPLPPGRAGFRAGKP